MPPAALKMLRVPGAPAANRDKGGEREQEYVKERLKDMKMEVKALQYGREAWRRRGHGRRMAFGSLIN